MLTLVNSQPAEHLDRREDGSLDVVSVFRTLQGEGPLVGVPSIFVRLAGCNYLCPACDTQYTEGRSRQLFDDLAVCVESMTQDSKINQVVLTGGEPFRQNFVPFADLLLYKDYGLQIETNGTLCSVLFVELAEGAPKEQLSVVCSPKGPKINDALAPFIGAYKYILDADNIADDGLPKTTMGLSTPVARPPGKWCPQWVYVQPLDTGDPVQNQRNVQACINSCYQHGYRLSYQIHKLLGLE